MHIYVTETVGAFSILHFFCKNLVILSGRSAEQCTQWNLELQKSLLADITARMRPTRSLSSTLIVARIRPTGSYSNLLVIGG